MTFEEGKIVLKYDFGEAKSYYSVDGAIKAIKSRRPDTVIFYYPDKSIDLKQILKYNIRSVSILDPLYKMDIENVISEAIPKKRPKAIRLKKWEIVLRGKAIVGTDRLNVKTLSKFESIYFENIGGEIKISMKNCNKSEASFDTLSFKNISHGIELPKAMKVHTLVIDNCNPLPKSYPHITRYIKILNSEISGRDFKKILASVDKRVDIKIENCRIDGIDFRNSHLINSISISTPYPFEADFSEICTKKLSLTIPRMNVAIDMRHLRRVSERYPEGSEVSISAVNNALGNISIKNVGAVSISTREYDSIRVDNCGDVTLSSVSNLRAVEATDINHLTISDASGRDLSVNGFTTRVLYLKNCKFTSVSISSEVWDFINIKSMDAASLSVECNHAEYVYIKESHILRIDRMLSQNLRKVSITESYIESMLNIKPFVDVEFVNMSKGISLDDCRTIPPSNPITFRKCHVMLGSDANLNSMREIYIQNSTISFTDLLRLQSRSINSRLVQIEESHAIVYTPHLSDRTSDPSNDRRRWRLIPPIPPSTSSTTRNPSILFNWNRRETPRPIVKKNLKIRDGMTYQFADYFKQSEEAEAERIRILSGKYDEERKLWAICYYLTKLESIEYLSGGDLEAMEKATTPSPHDSESVLEGKKLLRKKMMKKFLVNHVMF